MAALDRRSVRRFTSWHAVTVAVLVVIALPLLATTAGAHPLRHDGGHTGQRSPLSIDWAQSGTATATSAGSGDAPSNAIDGNAGTDWCPSGWTGSLTVDLGQVRDLDGLGITLDATSPSADATISLAAQPGQWQPLPSARNVALDPGQPMYVPMSRRAAARYVRLTVYSGTGAPVCVGELRLFAPDPSAHRMALGADLSFTPQELASGAVFTEHGRPASPVTIMRHNGADYVRMRLWVDPPAGYSDLAYDLALARAARAEGMKIYLDIMYSDFWADPTKQCIPSGWPTTLGPLAAKVRSYTEQVVSAFAGQGTPIAMASIGNEVTNGMLWSPPSAPPGTDWGCSGPGVGGLTWTSNTTATGWSNFATLLRAGVQGAKAGNPRGNRLLIMIHSDLGGNLAKAEAFYQNLIAQHVHFNVIGLSYYPFFQGPLPDLKATVDGLAGTLHFPIVIAETQYPWTLANGNSALGDTTGDFVWEPSQLAPGYPASPGGQLSFVNDELSTLAQAPNGLGFGLFYWAPDWIPGVGWAPGPGVGSPNVNLTLFNFEGAALPSVGIFRNPADVCASYDRDQVPCVIGG